MRKRLCETQRKNTRTLKYEEPKEKKINQDAYFEKMKIIFQKTNRMNNKLTINLVVMLLCMTCLTIKAATAPSDSVTVDEMTAMFYQHYINGMRPKSLDEYDLLKWNMHSKDSMYFCYLVNNEMLKNPKGIKLPVSEYVFYGDTLCWVKPRQGMPVKEFEQLVQKLQKKYGRIHGCPTASASKMPIIKGSTP